MVSVSAGLAELIGLGATITDWVAEPTAGAAGDGGGGAAGADVAASGTGNRTEFETDAPFFAEVARLAAGLDEPAGAEISFSSLFDSDGAAGRVANSWRARDSCCASGAGAESSEVAPLSD